MLNENNQVNAPDVIYRKEQQIELLNQTSKTKRSPKAELYHGFEVGNAVALPLNRVNLGLRSTLTISSAL